MLKHSELTETRIARTVDRMKRIVFSQSVPLTVEAWRWRGEPVAGNEALQKEFSPFAIGERWGHVWGTTWFRFTGVVPTDWQGEEVVALVDLGWMGNEGFTAEGLVWRDGLPARALNIHRSDVPVTECAAGGEAVSFSVEAAANPNVLGYGADPTNLESPDEQFILRKAELTCFNREVYSLFQDYRVAADAMRALPADSSRRGQLLYALNHAANIFVESDAATFEPTRRIIAPLLAMKNGDSAHQISALGHAHIDTAWLWPLRETIRKCARTFSTALAYMQEYPEYVFGCSQPQQYAWMKEYYPSIFEGIKDAIQRGQWNAMGSMWIEPDCNIPSGESLVRQILYGKNFFLDEFGIETKEVWLPDVFGYSAAMPQIMRKAGIEYFLTQKMSWCKINRFPHQTFLWEGIDGTRIFTHFPPADTYNAVFSAAELTFNVKNFREHDRANRSLYVYGFGDGGGGPTKEMLETARRVRDFDGLPKVTLEKVEDFFAKAEADAKDLPVWVGELYLEMHRGTYTTQARNKRGNRKCEFLLRDAEFLDAISISRSNERAIAGREVPPHAVYDVIGRDGATSNATYLERAWKLLLLNQFHDIIPGSSIEWVYRDSDRDYETIEKLGASVRDERLDCLISEIDSSQVENPLLVLNTLSHARREVVSLPSGVPMVVEVPPCGYTVVDAGGKVDQRGGVTVERGEGYILVDNGILRIRLDKDGLLDEVFDHRSQRQVLAPGAKGNLFQLHSDQPNDWDAWDVDLFYKENVRDLVAQEVIEIVEETALRCTIRVVRMFGSSRIEQNIVVRSGSPRIDFETVVDWREKHKFLKAAFPVNIRSARATYEVQYGHIERPTHYNTSWDFARFEVVAQKWVDLSEGDYGVALLNDCKYGHDIFENVMRISLLRASTAPDPTADQGRHQFVYSLLPHPEGVIRGGVIEEAYNLNVPLTVAAIEPKHGRLPAMASFFEVSRDGLIIESIKRAEKEAAIIVRLYESYGTRGAALIKTSLPVREAFQADLMERSGEAIRLENGTLKIEVAPFEIITLKLWLA